MIVCVWGRTMVGNVMIICVWRRVMYERLWSDYDKMYLDKSYVGTVMGKCYVGTVMIFFLYIYFLKFVF